MTNIELKLQGKNSKVIRIRKLIKIAASTLLLLNLTSCATYKSSFNCGDAKGVYCAPMDMVDRMIDSGEIERFNEQRQKPQKYKPLKNSDIPGLTEQEISKNKEVNNAGI